MLAHARCNLGGGQEFRYLGALSKRSLFRFGTHYFPDASGPVSPPAVTRLVRDQAGGSCACARYVLCMAGGRWLAIVAMVGALAGCSKESRELPPPLKARDLPRFQDSLSSYACPVYASKTDAQRSRERYRGWLRALRREYPGGSQREIRARRQFVDSEVASEVQTVTLRQLVDDYIRFGQASADGAPTRSAARCYRRFVQDMEGLQR